ncbi:phage integrase SAM-like domain-containing protein [Desertivirga xinjiangensis]|uniref:phage integrase SAM-like domain-containing protein n=1 Tax=Desertivirga xinjiangensis TaxID=539206 RepID=UPI0021099D56|nr:phage integrase SAM-like domain-containing protein [Pedobacter xinjiangensis]
MSTTIKATILKHHKKTDGTYNVKIRITHNRMSRYLDTNHHVTDKQLKKDLSIKDSVILLSLDKTINAYRKKISELNDRLYSFDCDALVKHLTARTEEIDIIEFGRAFYGRLIKEGKPGSAGNIRAVVFSLIDFFKNDSVPIINITSKMLENYEKYLRTERSLTRNIPGRKSYIINSPPLSDAGLHNHMRDLRLLFNAARNYYNDEDLGIIRVPNYPFKKYKIKPRPETKKRNLTISEVLKIKNFKPEMVDGRVELAKDLFMLSLYMCGTNSVDFYYLTRSNIVNDRLEYKRAKTKSKRKDQAFISLKIVDEAKPLVAKYVGILSERYSTHTGLSTALSYGMRKLQKLLEIEEVTFYWARHTFATLARNKCRKSKDDVALALNHVDEGTKVTDIYIEKDWSIVDEVQEAVVKLFR